MVSARINRYSYFAKLASHFLLISDTMSCTSAKISDFSAAFGRA